MDRKRRDEYNPVAFRLTKAREEFTIWDGFELWARHHLADRGGSQETVGNYRSDFKKLQERLYPL
ncbi:hypothetical protein SAMN00808754_0798 [Thermanaeromonas toyohensis ToBE]|uniref:Phage integrase, N-terminal SAM-like domain n=1 Tax=Thermanaeromonas toyohensis ToBE TaxID=698762 RepID=A0A1W1VID5_9FIRM|nr:hypothetical protein [Thermanaeromonas toyohensis]SMB93139.1 hypothetical protein SAMN00808754_0798 [Thermanaeromonas toyohensis ToBE]